MPNTTRASLPRFQENPSLFPQFYSRENQKTCGNGGRTSGVLKFGEEISEQLDYRPASLFVWQHVRFKYACPQCHDHVTAAPVPVAVIDKGLPGLGLLAQIAACK